MNDNRQVGDLRISWTRNDAETNEKKKQYLCNAKVSEDHYSLKKKYRRPRKNWTKVKKVEQNGRGKQERNFYRLQEF
jgi:hypothetical protein